MESAPQEALRQGQRFWSEEHVLAGSIRPLPVGDHGARIDPNFECGGTTLLLFTASGLDFHLPKPQENLKW